MALVIILGVILWGVLSWLKRHFINTQYDEHTSKLPKDFFNNPDSKFTDEQKRQTYAEIRKKFLEEKHKKEEKMRKDFVEEAFLRKEVRDEFGYFDYDNNEGAFALAERRRRKNEAIRRYKKEMEKKMTDTSSTSKVDE